MNAPPAGGHARSGWRTPLEFLPLLVFFAVNWRWGILPATAAILAATAVAVAILWRIEGRVPRLPLVTAGLLALFGGLTLAFDDPVFIKLKPTVVSLLFAVVLAGAAFRGVLLLRLAFGAAFDLEEAVWRVLTWRWAGFFVLLAVLNEVVWRNFSTDDWVSFKTFGILPLTFVFALSQMPLMSRGRKVPGEGR